MWEWVSEVAAGLLVAFLAGVTTWLLGRHTYRLELKRREIAGLQRLIGDLSRRRALKKTPDSPIIEPSDPNDPDLSYTTTSIFEARNAVDQARLAAEEGSKVHPVLDDMSIHCNMYIHASRHQPREYVALLRDLRSSLIIDLRELRKIYPKLSKVEPGTKAYEEVPRDSA